MKRILVGLIALGLAMGLMFGCVLNPGETVEITTASGVAATSGLVSGDIILQVKDSAGNVTEQFTWGADGTWTWESWGYESKADTDDSNNNGTDGEGVWFMDAGLKGTYSYAAATSMLTLEWMGNTYESLGVDEGFAWTGNWGGTFDSANYNYGTSVNADAKDEGDSPLNGGAALKTMETVDFSDVLGMTPGESDVTNADWCSGVGATADEFLEDAFNPLYASGTWTYTYYDYASGVGTAADPIKMTSNTGTYSMVIDNAAQTVTYTAESYSYDTEGVQTGAAGEKAVYSFIDPEVYYESALDDGFVYDSGWNSTVKDVSAVSDDVFRFTLWEELQDDTDSQTTGSLSYTLGDGDFRTTGSWDIDNNTPGYDNANYRFGGFMNTGAGIVIP